LGWERIVGWGGGRAKQKVRAIKHGNWTPATLIGTTDGETIRSEDLIIAVEGSQTVKRMKEKRQSSMLTNPGLGEVAKNPKKKTPSPLKMLASHAEDSRENAIVQVRTWFSPVNLHGG